MDGIELTSVMYYVPSTDVILEYFWMDSCTFPNTDKHNINKLLYGPQAFEWHREVLT